MNYRITPQDDFQKALKALRAGDVLTLSAGVYKGGCKGSGPANKANPIVVRGEPEATIDGHGLTDGLVLMNAPYWRVQELTIINAVRGLYAANSDHLLVQSVLSHNHRVQGMLISESDYIRVSNCEVWDIDEQHCLYVSRGRFAVIETSKFHGASGCDVQFGWQGTQTPETDINDPNNSAGVIQACEMYSSGFGRGGAAVNLLNLRGAEVKACNIHDCLAGGVSAYASNDVDVHDNIIRITKDVKRACGMSSNASKRVGFTRNRWEMGTAQPPFQTVGGAEITTVGNVPYLEATS